MTHTTILSVTRLFHPERAETLRHDKYTYLIIRRSPDSGVPHTCIYLWLWSVIVRSHPQIKSPKKKRGNRRPSTSLSAASSELRLNLLVSKRAASTEVESYVLAYLWSLKGLVWAVPGIRNGHGKYYGQCSGGRVLGGGIHKETKVVVKSFVF